MTTITWRKAQRSSGQGDDCVEVARLPHAIGVRDSKDPGGPHLILDHDAFEALVNELGFRDGRRSRRTGF